MNQIHVPQLLSTFTVILGDTVAALACALQHADLGEEVLLVGQGTCLYGDMHRSGNYALPPEIDESWLARLFPASCRVRPALAHPDRLKQHGERLCEAAGVRVLYAAQAVQAENGQLLIAHKSGLYAIAFHQIYDCRALEATQHQGPRQYRLHMLGAPDRLPPGFCLPFDQVERRLCIPAHTPLLWEHGAAGADHATLSIPVVGEADDCAAHTRHALYRLAMHAFTAAKEQPGCQGLTLARSGFDCTPMQGVDVVRCIREGVACPAGLASLNTDIKVPLPNLRYDNPMFPHRNVTLRCPSPTRTWEGDVIVVGGGTSGALAALSAARQGFRVLLVEMNGTLGGTGTRGGVSIYWFGTRDGATAQIDAQVDLLYSELGLPRSSCLWNQHDVFLPDIKAHALLSLCLEAGVHIALDAVTCAAIEQNHELKGIAYAQGGKFYVAYGGFVIDTTGDADVAMFIGAQHTYGGNKNALTYWGSLAQYTTPGNYRNNFSTMVHVGDPLDYTRFILAGRKRGENLYDHGDYVALRESRHIRSLHDVSLHALLRMEAPSDTLYQCFSNYDPKGKLSADIVYAGLLPPNLLLNVPLGAVIALDDAKLPIRGLLVGGKAIGCTHDALPGLRMQPDLQQQGFALGILAALSLRQGVQPWQVSGLSEAIETAGGQRIVPCSPHALPPQQAVDALTGDEAMEWLDMPPAEWVSFQPPVVTCFLASPADILPALREAWDSEQYDKKRLLLARLLLWHGSEEGVSLLLEEIRAQLNNADCLPTRYGPTNFGQLLPDHGLMPETVYLLNTLAWGEKVPVIDVFASVLARLLEGPRDWRDLRAGVYCYVECFAYVAMRRGEQAFLPMLRALLQLPELSAHSTADDLLAERYAMLQLTLYEAIARLGERDGYEGLRTLRHHPVQAIRSSACLLLTDLGDVPNVQRIRTRIH